MNIDSSFDARENDRMPEWSQGPDESADLRYTCPKCGRIFNGPTEDWQCPNCKETLRILGALRLRDRRRPASYGDLGDSDAGTF